MHGKAVIRRFSLNRGKPFFLKWLVVFICCQLTVFIICFILQGHTEKSLDSELKNEQLDWLVQAAHGIQTWRGDMAHSARLVSSLEEFAEFATAVSKQDMAWLARLDASGFPHTQGENARIFASSLADAQKKLNELVDTGLWPGCALLSPSGVLLAKAGKVSETDAVALAKKAGMSGHLEFGALRQTSRMAVMDLAVPIRDPSRSPACSTILCLTVPMRSMLLSLLHTRSGSERIMPALVFRDGQNFSTIMEFGDSLAVEPARILTPELENMPFASRGSLDGKEMVYSLALAQNNPDWLLVAETPAQEIASLRSAWTMRIYCVGVSCGFLIFLLFMTFWRVGRTTALEEFAGRNAELEAKARNLGEMLSAINNVLTEGILLLDADGTVRKANQELLKICGKTGNFIGKPISSILPAPDATRLLKHIKLVNDMGQSGAMNLALPASNSSGKEALYRITLLPTSISGNGGGKAVMAVFENITQRRRDAEIARDREAALITAMGRAIESVDPNLVGHADKMAAIAGKLACAFSLEENEKETLRITSHLSQIGKLFVPRELLLKKDALSREELEELRRAPYHTDKLLGDLHFDLPVRESARMIGERINGNGRPYGLMGDEISLVGRILAVANAFVAMTSPRAWRVGGGMRIDEALEHLRADAGFDQNVVAALASISAEELAEALSMEVSC